MVNRALETSGYTVEFVLTDAIINLWGIQLKKNYVEKIVVRNIVSIENFSNYPQKRMGEITASVYFDSHIPSRKTRI